MAIEDREVGGRGKGVEVVARSIICCFFQSRNKGTEARRNNI